MQLILKPPSTQAAAELVACKIVRGRNFIHGWHQHPECELTLVRRGGAERWVGDKLSPLRPGDLVFLGSGLPHEYRNDSKRKHAGLEAMVVQFSPQLLGPDWLDLASLRAARRLFDRARLGLEITGETRRRAVLLMTRLSGESGLRRVITLLEILDLLAASKDLARIASPGFDPSGRGDPTDRVGKVLRQIEESLAEPLHLPNFATLAGLSTSAFGRLFKRVTGRTFPQYVNELRIARACRLLAETDDTVSQIAASCGYRHAAHFQRQFRQTQQRTPLEYRRAARRQK